MPSKKWVVTRAMRPETVDIKNWLHVTWALTRISILYNLQWWWCYLLTHFIIHINSKNSCLLTDFQFNVCLILIWHRSKFLTADPKSSTQDIQNRNWACMHNQQKTRQLSDAALNHYYSPPPQLKQTDQCVICLVLRDMTLVRRLQMHAYRDWIAELIKFRLHMSQW
jgi:hypothetical protein